MGFSQKTAASLQKQTHAHAHAQVQWASPLVVTAVRPAVTRYIKKTH